MPARHKKSPKSSRVSNHKFQSRHHPIPFLAIAVGVVGVISLFALINHTYSLPLLNDISFANLPTCNTLRAKINRNTLSYTSNVIVVNSNDAGALVQCSFNLVNPKGQVVSSWKKLATPDNVKYRWCKDDLNLLDAARRDKFSYPARGTWKLILNPVQTGVDKVEGKACLATFKVN